MQLTKDEIKNAVMQLDPVEREALLDELRLAITPEEQDAIDQAWIEEADRRMTALERGEAHLESVDDVIAKIETGRN